MNAADAAFSMWRVEPALLLGLAIAAVLYIRGWRVLHRILPGRFPVWRALCFLGGLVALWISVASPLDALAGFLLQAHMAQHLLLTMVVPPLVLGGAPYLPILRGLPRPWARGIAAPILSAPVVVGLGRLLTHPGVAWLLFTTSNVVWHIPPFYDAALRSEMWHAVEHFCFLGTGFLFWWFVVQPWPSRARWPEWVAIPYLLLADLQNTALAAFLTFYDKPLYPAYADVPRLWGSDLLSDQSAAGLLMWIPGSIGFLVPAGFIAIRLLTRNRGVRPTDYYAPQSRSLQKPAPVAASRWTRHLPRPNPITLRTLLRSVLLALAILIIWDGLFGPEVSSMNLAGVLPWTFWRGFAIIALLLAGNIVCTGCPFMLVRDWARKFAPAPTRNWPRALRNKWTAFALLALFFWAYEVFDLWDRPVATAWIILGYFGAATAVDLIFRGASFCKWICPIGQYNYAIAANAPMEVRVTDMSVCASCQTHDCLRGNDNARGCELHLFQPKKAGNFDCTGCLDCVAACPPKNVALQPVVPAIDLASRQRRSSVGDYAKRPDLAALVALLTAAALVNAAAMTAPVQEALLALGAAVGIADWLVMSVFLIGGLGILTGALVAAGPQTPFAFLPLGASVWAAHFLFHLFTGFWTFIPVTQRFLGDLGLPIGTPDWGLIGFSGDWILALELTLLDFGWLVTLFLLWKVAADQRVKSSQSKWWWPRAALATIFFLAAVWVLFQPMEMRGTTELMP